MPIAVERLPNEPILMASFTGYITVEDIKEMYRQVTALIADEPGIFYRISDVRAGTTNFLEMAKIVQTATQGMSASSMDERIHVTYVGTSSWINFARDVFKKRGVPMAAFEDIETALESIRWRIAHDSKDHPLDGANRRAAVSSS